MKEVLYYLHTLHINYYVANYILLACPLYLEPIQTVLQPEAKTEVDIGYTLDLICVAYGDPLPSITWSRAGNILQMSNSSDITIYEEVVIEGGVTFAKSILQICDAEESDIYQFNCTATSVDMNDSVSFALSVHALPGTETLWSIPIITLYFNVCTFLCRTSTDCDWTRNV